jgi:hypothetical protein
MRLFPIAAAFAAILCASSTAADMAAAEAIASAETTGRSFLDLRQVDFRLVRIVSEDEFRANPDAHELIDSRTHDGEPLSIPIVAQPLMRVVNLDHAVVRQDAYGLYHMEVHLTPDAAATYAAVTEQSPGAHVLWMSRDKILAELAITGREERGMFTIYFGDSPLESIENVLRILQVPYTVEVAEDLVVPESRADELRLEAMRELQLRPNAEGRRRAIRLLADAVNEGGVDYEYRSRMLYVIASLYVQQEQFEEAKQVLGILRNDHADFEDMLSVLLTLQQIAVLENDRDRILETSREIVEMEDGEGLVAIQAQSVITNSMRSENPRPPEFEGEVGRMIRMLRDFIVQLPPQDRHAYELRIVRYLIEVNAEDELQRTARGLIEKLPDDPIQATLAANDIVNMLAMNGRNQLAVETLERYQQIFEDRYDIHDEQLVPIWDAIGEGIIRMRAESDTGSAAVSPETAAVTSAPASS